MVAGGLGPGLDRPENNARERSHQCQVTQRGAVPNGDGAEEEANTHTDAARRNPSARVEPTAADQRLPDAENEPGHQAAEQCRECVIDAACDQFAGDTSDGEGDKACGPEQPGTKEDRL